MKPFVMQSSMTTMSGVFYPTGHAVLMFPGGHEDARKACKALAAVGIDDDEMSLLSPEVIMSDITRTVGSADIPLPSVGTEADTVRQMSHLAAQGHWGLLVHAPHQKDSDLIRKAIENIPVSYAQKYRQLVIEDL
ncbi:RNA-binding protein [Ramlibacter sp. AW1]|uniref:RNA-binding protein n=1 Tax=Ramlibacter aurantiacus TaxID=2801330 RepID=A0A936ZEC3_9BURK|nr:RNA-binding protein [Ramlibacter aurantiacus]MBL0419382.1 RNA-binding protein [Ramlibacter aurantiacus]